MTATGSRHRRKDRARVGQAAARRRLIAAIVALAGGALFSLGALVYWSKRQSSAEAPSAEQGPGAGRYAFQVGKPGPGGRAPGFVLPSTKGGVLDLASLRGKRVLLYFQEGIMSQPCWDQLRDIESNVERLRALGIDAIVAITTDPVEPLQRKAALEGLATPVLSDRDLNVSKEYDANSYGMAGPGRDGHTFILVERDGRIVWRADYGAAPKYHMYVPVPNLLADMRAGLAKAAVSPL